MAPRAEILEAAGREVTVTNPHKVYFPSTGATKLDLVRYYLAVAEPVLRAIGGRPLVLRRFVHGVEEKPFFQKRAPAKRPDWIETVVLSFPSGRTAEEIVVRDAAQLAWVVNLGCIEQHPHPVRATDLEHPDELRIDLDPVPGVEWPQIVEVAAVTREVLDELELTGWPKTSGSRGLHVDVRIQARWGFAEVRRAALAIAREVERRAPELATSRWWKEERHGVFLDYNQNAKDRTVAAAYSVRPTPDARVSMPFDWSELREVDPADHTLATVPTTVEQRRDARSGIDDAPGSLERTLELVARHEEEGLGDAPWPPYYRKPSGGSKDSESEPETDTGRGRPAKRRKGARRPSQPLVTVAQAEDEADARAGLERWRARHPEAAQRLEPADVLVDAMRGRSSTWTRIRVNLRHVPEDLRPEQETPDPDYDPWREWRRARGGDSTQEDG
ncbi:MAG TPA: non-homologous end-joining DNA ligase [Thermoanaerobaculia bacterium]|nr:non-homologous end-joining DNA ligase [Thermoanaerobaculia bacterium]